jgi:hypothetical protein
MFTFIGDELLSSNKLSVQSVQYDLQVFRYA